MHHEFKSETRTPRDIACDSQTENYHSAPRKWPIVPVLARPVKTHDMQSWLRLCTDLKRSINQSINPHFTSKLRDSYKVSSTISQLYLAPCSEPQKKIWGKRFHYSINWRNSSGEKRVRGAKQRVLCTGNFWPGLHCRGGTSTILAGSKSPWGR